MELIRDTIDLSEYLKAPASAQAVRPAADYTDQVIKHYYDPDPASVGAVLPWTKAEQDFRFRPGETTIWGGINSHGKSMVLSHVKLGLMQQQEQVFEASLEMKPFRTMARIVRQASGMRVPTIKFIKEFHEWTNGKYWIYDKFGISTPETMMALMRYVVDKYGITHFIIDNMNKIVRGDDNYNAQKDFVNDIYDLTADLNIHTHIVMHVRKGADEKEIPNKFSIKGTGSVTDTVDNLFIVWRNKEKERLLRENPQDLTVIAEPDAVVVLDKQRNGEVEGRYNLWFDPASNQYLEHRNSIPKRFNLDDIYS